MAKVVLISCVSKKLRHSAPAGELYVSPLFRMNLAYAKSMRPSAVYILSAKYGLLELDHVIHPYNETLNTMPMARVKKWAERVLRELGARHDLRKDEFVFLAGERYRKFLMPHMTRATVPMKGLGIGRQLKYLKHATR